MTPSRGIRSLQFAAVALLALACAAAAADPVLRTFDDDPPDMAPPGFAFSTARQQTPGDWLVRASGEQHYLEHVADPSAGGLSFAVLGLPMKNIQLYVRLRLLDGPGVGGAVWRYQDSNNYYSVGINLRLREATLHRIVSGNRVQLDQAADLHLDQAQWHLLSIRQQGDDIRVELDGIGLLHARDGGFESLGRTGVWSGGGSRSWFDDLRIEDIAGQRW
jgi:hypothetical protein